MVNAITYLSAAAAVKSLQSCPTLCDPIDGSPPGSPVPGILQEGILEWVPLPSPMHESEKWKWSRSVMSESSRPHGPQPTRLLRPWDFPGKSTGVGCHCLLQLTYHESVIIFTYKVFEMFKSNLGESWVYKLPFKNHVNNNVHKC